MIGIDYGVRRVAVACPSQRWAGAFESKAESRSTQLWEIQHWVRAQIFNALAMEDDEPIFVESPIGGATGNMRTAVQMGETSGAILACFPGRAVQVAPSSWKALVCGHGSLGKADVAAWLEQHHPALAEACRKPSGKLDQDRVDATCIALCTTAGLAEQSSVQGRRHRRLLRARPQPGDQP